MPHVEDNGDGAVARSGDIAENKVEVEIVGVAVVIAGQCHGHGVLVVLVAAFPHQCDFCPDVKLVPHIVDVVEPDAGYGTFQ